MGIERRVSLVKPGDEPGKAWPAIAMGFFVAFGGVLFGYDTGTISGILNMSSSPLSFSVEASSSSSLTCGRAFANIVSL